MGSGCTRRVVPHSVNNLSLGRAMIKELYVICNLIVVALQKVRKKKIILFKKERGIYVLLYSKYHTIFNIREHLIK